MPRVYNPAIVAVAKYIVAVHALNRTFKHTQKVAHNFPLYEYVVGRHAGLTRVHEFAPGNALAGDGKICLVRDYYGALAAELERHGHKVVRRGAHDYLAYVYAARKENLVKAAGYQF